MKYWEKEASGGLARTADGRVYERFSYERSRWVVVDEPLPFLSSEIRFSGNWDPVTEAEALAIIARYKAKYANN